MHSVIEHLRSHAPAHATFYRLVGRSPNGEYGLFPKDGNAFYGVGEAPRGLYPSLYQVFYFDASGRQIQHARVELQLSEAMAAALGPRDSAEAYLPAAVAENPARRSLGPATGQLALPLPQGPSASASATLQSDLTREQAVHKMTLESDRQKQEFIHNSVHIREVGEALMINRMMRQEMMELNKNAQLNSQAAFADVEKQVAALRLLRQAQKETLEFMNEVAAATPPPPPQKVDWLPLAHQAIQAFAEIGTALVKTRLAAPPAQAPQTAPEPAASTAAKDKGRSAEVPRGNPKPLETPTKPSPSLVDWSALPERPESD